MFRDRWLKSTLKWSYPSAILNIEAERKSIYTDIEHLREFGVDILCEKGRANNYYIGARDFELAELKLLVDSVQASKFITHKKATCLSKN